MPSPCHRVVSLDKKLYPTLSLSTQVYKMGTGDILLGVTLRWTSIPSRWGGGGGVEYSQLLHATETRISSGRVGLLGSCVTLPFTLPGTCLYTCTPDNRETHCEEKILV